MLFNRCLPLKAFSLFRKSHWQRTTCQIVLGCLLACEGSGALRAQEVQVLPRDRPQWPHTEGFQLPSNPEPTLRIGGYVGALSEQSLIGITVIRPWRPKIQSDALVDVHAIYTAYRFPNIPIDLEIEGGIAKHFGWSNQMEFDLAPMVRWKWLPWNEYVYTNFRLGLVGLSYDTSVPDWERHQVGRYDKRSRFLNFLVPEFTFSPSKDAPFEVFVRVHHRSGAYGVIIKDQASNYISAGVRFTAF
jgi:hypothetical protein